jgi:hypothetical protein
MDAPTASVITGLGAAVVVAGSTLLGAVLTFRVGRQQRDRDERLQASRDLQARLEVRAYRNHDRRAQAAGNYIASLNLFRRGVKDLNEGDKDQRANVQAYARASEDAGALVDLYFSTTVHDLSAAAAEIVGNMHRARLRGGLKDDVMRARDNDAKMARDSLINAMKRELGESGDTGRGDLRLVQAPLDLGRDAEQGKTHTDLSD